MIQEIYNWAKLAGAKLENDLAQAKIKDKTAAIANIAQVAEEVADEINKPRDDLKVEWETRQPVEVRMNEEMGRGEETRMGSQGQNKGKRLAVCST